MNTDRYVVVKPIRTLRDLLGWLVRLVPLLVATIAWQLGDTFALDVGTLADEDVVSGFYEREANEQATYRWSSYRSTLTLPARYLPAVLDIEGTVVPGGTRVSLLSADETFRVDLPPTAGEPVMRHYRVLWPATSTPTGWFSIEVAADRLENTLDARSLGLLIRTITLTATHHAAQVPPLLVLLIGILPLSLEACLRLANIRRAISLALSMLVGLLTIAVWFWIPLWIQPFVPYIVATLLFLAGMLWWNRWVVTHQQANKLPYLYIILVAWSGAIPLYLALRYGVRSWYHPDNMRFVAMGAALLLPLVGGRVRRGLLWTIVAGLIIYGVHRYTTLFLSDYSNDFTALFRGPRSFLSGDPLYKLEVLQGNPLVNTYKYPPFFVFLMGPITGLPYVPAFYIWRGFNLLLLCLALLLLWRWSGQPLRSWSTVGLLYLLLVFRPLSESLGYGQLDIVILVSLAAALLALKHGRWGWWGAALAVPAAIKLYPAFLVVHTVFSRFRAKKPQMNIDKHRFPEQSVFIRVSLWLKQGIQWRGVVGFVVGFVVLTGLAIAVFGWDVHLMYLTEVLPVSGGGTAWVENQTINGWLNRLVTNRIELGPDSPGIVRWLTYAAAVVMVFLTVLLTMRCSDGAATMRRGDATDEANMLQRDDATVRRRDESGAGDDHAGFGLWIITMLIILPAAWIHYQAILIIPLYQLFVRLERQTTGIRWQPLVMISLAWMLLCYGNQWTFFDLSYHGPIWALLLSYKLYALLLLWGATVKFSTDAHR